MMGGASVIASSDTRDQGAAAASTAGRGQVARDERGGFRALLDAARVVSANGLAERAEASAAWMFEPPPTAGEPQREALREESDVAGGGATAEDLSDASGVHARKQAANAESKVEPEGAAAQSLRRPTTEQRQIALTPVESPDARIAGAEDRGQTHRSAEVDAPTARVEGTAAPVATPRGDAGLHNTPTNRPSQPPAPVSAGAATAVRSSESGLPPASVTTATVAVARQVAEWLASQSAGQAARGASTGGQPLAMGVKGSADLPAASVQRDSGRAAPEGAIHTGEETQRAAMERMVRAMRVNVTEGRASARMQLQPAELGQMTVDVRLQGDALSVAVRTESEAARVLLSQRARELRTALEQHGVRVERLEVSTDTQLPVAVVQPPPLPSTPPPVQAETQSRRQRDEREPSAGERSSLARIRPAGSEHADEQHEVTPSPA